ncbi:MAG: SpoIIE family protein phosphatase [Sumerlaeia bacterium]
MPKLLVEQGPLLGLEFKLDGPGRYLVGRHPDADIELPDHHASRYHAEVRFSHGGDCWTVHDLNSSNGTFVNGERLTVMRTLVSGDRITIGDTILAFDPHRASDVEIVAGRDSGEVAVAKATVGDEGTLLGFDFGAGHLSALETLDPLTQLKIVYHYADLMRQATTLGQVLDTVQDAAFRVLCPDRVAVLLKTGCDGALEPAASRNAVPRNVTGRSRALTINNAIIALCVEKRKPVVVRDAISDERFSSCNSIQAADVGSALSMPLISGNEVVGVVYVDTIRGARPFSEPVIELAAAIGNQAALAIANALHHQSEIERREERMQLEVARRIHGRLLANSTFENREVEAFGYNRPSSHVGGDFHGIFKTEKGPLLAIADSTGHGVGAALLMSTVRAYLLATLEASDLSLSELLTRLNKLLLPDMDRGLFISFLVARLHHDREGQLVLHYSCAGHEPPLLYRPSTDEFITLSVGGLVLGMAGDFPYKDAPPVVMEPRDTLCFFTDGVVEQMNPDGREFGLEGLRSALKAASREPTVKAASAAILARVDEWRGTQTQGDDLSLLLLRVRDRD